MIRRPPRSTRTDTLFPYTTLFRSVCTTELGEVAKLRPEWDKRNVKPIGLSIDPVEAHHKWELDIEETQGAALDFPMIADPDARVSSLYDMIHPESDPTVPVRSVFIIDPSKKVRQIGRASCRERVCQYV